MEQPISLIKYFFDM